MATVSPVQIIHVGVGLLLLGSMGCATTSQLDKLNVGLSTKFETMNRSVSSDVQALRADVSAMQASQRDLEGQLTQALEAVQADIRQSVNYIAAAEQGRREAFLQLQAETVETRNVVTEYASTSRQALEKIAAVTGEINRELREIEQAVAAIKKLPPILTGMSKQVRTLKQALLQSYKLEQVTLRSRLKALEHVTTQMNPAADAVSSEAGYTN